MFIFFSGIFVIILFFFFNFNKKLPCLLSLECLMLFMIIFYFYYNSWSGVFSFVSSMIFLTFMVLDSVFGLCILINCSRNSSFFMSIFSSI